MLGKRLSIVLPAYNEEGNIERVVNSFLETIGEINGACELIIVNDGSTDATRDICENLAQNYPFISCIHHSCNVGYGGSIISGFKAAKGDYVAMIDADGQFAPRDLLRLFVHTDSFDVVVGYRQRRADPLGRRILGRLWTLIGRLLFAIPIHDLNCALKIFKKSLISGFDLRCHGPGINLEIMAQLGAAGIPIKQVPCSHYARKFGSQSGGSLRVIQRALPELLYVLSMKLRKRPMRFL